MTLYERLSQLNKSDMLPLHMPGHKRSNVIPAMSGIYGIDITEIDGFDDLHDPGGIIAGMQKRASDLYGAGEARISVNGSTAAIEAAILSVCRAGDDAEEFSALVCDTCFAEGQSVVVEHLCCFCHKGIAELCRLQVCNAVLHT